MTSFTDLAATLQTLFTDEALDAAHASRWAQRRSKLSAPVFLQALVFGWLRHPTAPLEDLADLAADLGADVTPQALDQRLNPRATHFLSQVLTAALHRVVTTAPLALPLLRRFQGVYVFDTTARSLPAELAALFPGCGGSTPAAGQAALKCHVGLELLTGALELAVGPGRQPDVSSELARAPLPQGALRLADRGFFDLSVLRDYAEAGVFWLTRLPTRLVLRDAGGQKVRLAEWLGRCAADRVDQWVAVGDKLQLRCRLLGRRVPQEVAAERRERLRRQAKKKGRAVSAEQLALCGWNVAVTNVPVERLGFAEVWVLLRARWQIELLFKLWKSHGGLDKSQGRRPARVLCEVYAKLLGMLVQHWTLLVCGGPMLEWSYPKAARRVRRQAEALVQALGQLTAVAEVLGRLQRRLQKRCRVQGRVGRPSAYQLLQETERGPSAEDPQPDATEKQAA